MTIWAIADLHLYGATPSKNMETFGPIWKDHPQKLAALCHQEISADDLILLPGDLSWAATLQEAAIDLQYIDSLPGKKLIIEGNHDYWWASDSKLKKELPPSIIHLTEEPFEYNGIYFVGTRLWEHPDLYPEKEWSEESKARAIKIFDREKARLERSLARIPKEAKTRVALTHYPPIGKGGGGLHELYQKYGVSLALFGHIHGDPDGPWPEYGFLDGTFYKLVSYDHLKGAPWKLPL